MSDVVIRVENLGKKYIIGHEKPERYSTVRDSIANSAKGLLKSFQGGKSQGADPTREEFWALKDVSFEIKQGDRVGIIGRNGAGKSTLLKILSRITEPTKGQIKLRGRVASLLEVGTGFHPELTGRENISLNGAILGMSKEEIRRKFDEIVAFAEVEKFLDTPVKRYSSGMYVRLAFSVAAHLEPEILIVDEVLAVGDAQFQKKCLGKMEEVGKDGRTVLFVSHNMSTIESLCNTALLLKQGQIEEYDNVNKIIQSYVKSQKELLKTNEKGRLKISRELYIEKTEIQPNIIRSGDPLSLNICFSSSEDILIQHLVVLILNQMGTRVGVLDLRKTDLNAFMVNKDSICSIEVKIDKIPLIEGEYEIGFYIFGDNIQKDILGICSLLVEQKLRQDKLILAPAAHRGIVDLNYDFSVQQLNSMDVTNYEHC
jgi:lipopolysaccharide transport system ATP-binding protein